MARATAVAEGFAKDFPKITPRVMDASTGARPQGAVADQGTGRHQADVLHLADAAFAADLERRNGWESYVGPELDGYAAEHRSARAGNYFWSGVAFVGMAYNTQAVTGTAVPRTWRDLVHPRWRNAVSCLPATSALQHAQWYTLGKLYGDNFWRQFAEQRPRAFEGPSPLLDRLARGEEKFCATAEHGAFLEHRARKSRIELVMPSDGLPATPLLLGVIARAPHPNAARLFVDWMASKRGQAHQQSSAGVHICSVRSDAPSLPSGKRLEDFKLLLPADWDDYGRSRERFQKEWQAMVGA